MSALPVVSCKFMEWKPLGIEVVCFSPDGDWLAVGVHNAEIHIYSTCYWQIIASIPGNTEASIRSICWIENFSARNSDQSSSRKLREYNLISCGLDGHLTLWSLCNFKKVYAATSFGGAIFDATLSPDNKHLATACDDGTIRIYFISESEFLLHKTMQKHAGRILSVCWLSDQILFGGTATSTIHRYQLKGGYSDAKLQVDKTSSNKALKDQNKTQIWCLVCLKSFGLLVSGDSSGKVTFWDTSTCTFIHSFHEHQADVLALTVAKDEMSIISCGVDGKVTVYAASHSNANWVVMGYKYPHSHDIRSISISPKGPFVTGGVDASLSVMQSVSTISELTLHPLRLSVISPNASQWISVAQTERLFMCQYRDCVELW